MLQKLYISNYALIQEVNLDFQKGLTIITGETGAGKSILLGAMHLLLGDRADASMVKDTSKKCIIEAVWNIQQYNLQAYFADNDLDYDAVCIIRREISGANKSRAFINDTPANLQQLKELSSKLIDIHSQHDTLLIHNQQFLLQLLDAPANNISHLKEFSKKFNSWKKTQKEKNALELQEKKFADEEDFLKFQFDELELANITEKEFENIENEIDILSNIEEIKESYISSINLLEKEEGLLLQLKYFQQLLSNVSKFDATAEELKSRVQILDIEIKDILNDIKIKSDRIEPDPSKLENLTSRFNQLNHLLHKHRLSNAQELLFLKNSIQDKLRDTNDLSDKILELAKKEELLFNEVKEIAIKLSNNRKKILPELEQKSVELLRKLGIPDARIKIELITKENFDATGGDFAKLFFSANKGNELKEINKVGSGGELSRLMLSLKKIIAGSVALPTIVFDEIDTGISGAVADSMGEILKEMGTEMQVIAITHLPQIASKGDDHFKVLKSSIGQNTTTSIQQLSGTERINEIAAMLSGKALSEAAISNAKSLLGVELL
jgi:DNA repair protein RecN (Recombination protein N)